MSDLFPIYEDSLKIVIKTLNSTLQSEKINESVLENLHSNIKEAKRIVYLYL